MRQKSGARFTEKQGQHLAFIYTYSQMFGQPPAEKDIQRHFRVSPPSVHQMIVTLERNGLISRQPGVSRSIQILLPPEHLPILEWLGIKTSNHCDEPLADPRWLSAPSGPIALGCKNQSVRGLRRWPRPATVGFLIATANSTVSSPLRGHPASCLTGYYVSGRCPLGE